MQVIIDPGCVMRLMLHVLAAYEAYIISVFMGLYSDRINKVVAKQYTK